MHRNHRPQEDGEHPLAEHLTVSWTLLFIGAVEQGGETPSGDGMAESMYLWRKGVQMEFESLSQKYPNIHWAGVPGDHMFILHKSVPHREPILRFTGGKR